MKRVIVVHVVEVRLGHTEIVSVTGVRLRHREMWDILNVRLPPSTDPRDRSTPIACRRTGEAP